MCAFGPTPHPQPGGKLGQYWNRNVSDLVELNEPPISDEQQERHQIYLLMLMALVEAYWNPYKKGRAGYYLRTDNHSSWKTEYEYKGHNIGAIAVDQNGRVLDFNFNHNKLFNSSAEHAEARLVRRIFALAHLQDAYKGIKTMDRPQRLGEYDTLSEVTIYTSLESCAQCAGMMALGNVKAVVFLQSDPGMYRIGNILRNLSDDMPKAPRPIAAGEVGFGRYQTELEKRFKTFEAEMADPKEDPFWLPKNKRDGDRTPSISSFLATPAARRVFTRGGNAFRKLVSTQNLQFPSEPALGRDGKHVHGSLSNLEALEHAHVFFEYAKANGRRGTPHRV